MACCTNMLADLCRQQVPWVLQPAQGVQQEPPAGFPMKYQCMSYCRCRHLIVVCCCMFVNRLALARVSVLRGSGPLSGTAFIDDYVMSVEPVVDYLTRYSGIKPGKNSHQHATSDNSRTTSTCWRRLPCLANYICAPQETYCRR